MPSKEIIFLDKINEFFYEGVDRQTSIYLFGSASTGYYISGRSDLDLLIVVPETKLYTVGEKIRSWTWNPELPILDGYVLSSERGIRSAKHVEQFKRVAFPSDANIDLPDQWNIKNRSIHLFGEAIMPKIFPEIGQAQLQAWAIETIRSLARSNPSGNVPYNSTFKLSEVIWCTSWAARLLLLSRGQLCESKKEALSWLAAEYVEIAEPVRLLLKDYLKSDKDASSMTEEQAYMLAKFCFGLILKRANSQFILNDSKS